MIDDDLVFAQTTEGLTVMTVLQRVGTIVSGGGLSMNGRCLIIFRYYKSSYYYGAIFLGEDSINGWSS